VKLPGEDGWHRTWDVAVDANAGVWLAGQERVLCSANDGKTWKQFPVDGASSIAAVLPCPDGRVLAVGTGGIYARAGERFAPVFAAKGSFVRDACSGPSGRLVAVGHAGLAVASDDGKRWTPLGGGPSRAALQAVAWCDDRFVVVGTKGAMFETDGKRALRALPQPFGTRADLMGVAAFRGGVFVAGIRGLKGDVDRTASIHLRGALLWSGPALAAARAPRARPGPVMPAPIVRKRTAATAVPTPAKLTWKDAAKQFPVVKKQLVAAPPDEVLHYRGKLSIKALPSWRSAKSGSKRVVIFDGDLRLEGVCDLFASQDDDSELVVMVTGSLSARSVVLFDDPRLVVGGDLEAEQVVAAGGGTWGLLSVAGELRARALVASAHVTAQVRGATKAIVYASEPGLVAIGRAPDYTGTGAERILAPACVGDDRCADFEAVTAALRKGKDVLRKHVGS
jgi:hypothetical protein